jgi:hypothetical protein
LQNVNIKLFGIEKKLAVSHFSEGLGKLVLNLEELFAVYINIWHKLCDILQETCIHFAQYFPWE